MLAIEPPPAVRYYETMDKANEVCISRAEQLLEALGLSPELVKSVPERSNKFRQVGEDCGWWVLHYTEAEVRNKALEGWGACKAVSSVRKQEMWKS